MWECAMTSMSFCTHISFDLRNPLIFPFPFFWNVFYLGATLFFPLMNDALQNMRLSSRMWNQTAYLHWSSTHDGHSLLVISVRKGRLFNIESDEWSWSPTHTAIIREAAPPGHVCTKLDGLLLTSDFQLIRILTQASLQHTPAWMNSCQVRCSFGSGQSNNHSQWIHRNRRAEVLWCLDFVSFIVFCAIFEKNVSH